MSHPANLLLASLSASDAAALQPHLKVVHLEHEKVLFEAGGEVLDVYFPTGAIVSLVVVLSSGEMIEAAMVGKDGIVGASAALDGKISLNRGIVQLAGPALICSVAALRGAALQSQTLLSLLIRHEQTVYAQASQSAACIAAQIPCRDARRQAHQRHAARADPATGRDDQIRPGKNSDYRSRGDAGDRLRMLRHGQIVLSGAAGPSALEI